MWSAEPNHRAPDLLCDLPVWSVHAHRPGLRRSDARPDAAMGQKARHGALRAGSIPSRDRTLRSPFSARRGKCGDGPVGRFLGISSLGGTAAESPCKQVFRWAPRLCRLRSPQRWTHSVRCAVSCHTTTPCAHGSSCPGRRFDSKHPIGEEGSPPSRPAAKPPHLWYFTRSERRWQTASGRCGFASTR